MKILLVSLTFLFLSFSSHAEDKIRKELPSISSLVEIASAQFEGRRFCTFEPRYKLDDTIAVQAIESVRTFSHHDILQALDFLVLVHNERDEYIKKDYSPGVAVKGVEIGDDLNRLAEVNSTTVSDNDKVKNCYDYLFEYSQDNVILHLKKSLQIHDFNIRTLKSMKAEKLLNFLKEEYESGRQKR